MDPVREDLKELRRDVKDGMAALQEALQGLGEKLSKHALEDSEREGKTVGELGVMKTQLMTLASASEDRQKFVRGWIAGLAAVAIAAGIGFLFRAAIENQHTPVVLEK